jgi:Ca-activated chloride channel homolog
MKVAPLPVLAGAMVLAARLTFPTAAHAGTDKPKPTEGQLRTRDGKELVDVPLEHTKVSVRVAGFLADVEVEQRFHNPYARKIEAAYLFPLPTRAAVDAMEIVVGGRTIVGRLDLRERARQKYQVAVRNGQVAALLTEERPNLFTQAVGNIEPGARVTVRLRYVEALPFGDDGYELVFPLVAGPRHVPRSSQLTAEAAAAVQAPVLPPGLRSAHDVELAVDLDAGVPLGEVLSPSHRVVIDRPGGRSAAARIALAGDDTVPNKDFVLRWSVGGRTPELALLAHRASDRADGSFYLVAQPPPAAQVAADEIAPREVVFAIDTSSSMRGQPLAKAREAVKRVLAALGPDDTFQIIRFDDDAGALAPRWIANRPRNLELAAAWLDGLTAGGGTDMATAVRAALELPDDPGRLRLVVFLTDGYIGNEDEVLALVQEKLGRARLFAFGVGSAVNRYLLEEMAAVGRGAVQVVRPDEDTAAAAQRFAARLARPILTDVTIDWNGLPVKDVTPAAIPDLFVGQPLVVAGRYTRGGAATVTVIGTRAGQRVSFAVPVTLPEVDASRPAVATVWARARIAELARRQLRAERPLVKAEIIGLALANHLVTPYTAFVAVDTSRTTRGGVAETVAVPVEVPEGVRRDDEGGKGSHGVGYGAGLGVVGYGAGGGGLGASSIVIHEGARVLPSVAMPPVPARAKEPSYQQTASRHRDEIARCYAAEPADVVARAGKLTLRVVLGDGGAPAEVTTAALPAGVGVLLDCLRRAVTTWRFEADIARGTAFDLPLAPPPPAEPASSQEGR